MLIAIAIGVTIMAVGYWAVHLLSTPPPPEPDPYAVQVVDQTFACAVCGMQLTVNFAQGGELVAPKHCREEMEPV